MTLKLPLISPEQGSTMCSIKPEGRKVTVEARRCPMKEGRRILPS
jgi:hypothetical protein